MKRAAILIPLALIFSLAFLAGCCAVLPTGSPSSQVESNPNFVHLEFIPPSSTVTCHKVKSGNILELCYVSFSIKNVGTKPIHVSPMDMDSPSNDKFLVGQVSIGGVRGRSMGILQPSEISPTVQMNVGSDPNNRDSNGMEKAIPPGTYNIQVPVQVYDERSEWVGTSPYMFPVTVTVVND